MTQPSNQIGTNWRNLTNETYQELVGLFTSNGTLKEAIKVGHLHNGPTPLQVALDNFITENAQLRLLKTKADTLSASNEPVLVTGESGTGKELVARILHGNRQGGFVAVNITAVTETLFESELFGHVRGAYSGAMADRDGLIEAASEGTLFIDELGDMPLSCQAKLLRTIHEKTYRKVGTEKELPARCRFIFATHQNLPNLIAKGTFRLDLYYRINTFVLHTLPLRDRLEEIPLLANSFGLPESKEADFLKRLGIVMLGGGNNGWPGNVRELQTYVKRYLMFGEIV